MQTTATFDVQLTTVNCGECGGTYAINEMYHNHKRVSGGCWHCPYCDCWWGFVESENEKLRKQLKAKEYQLVRERATADQRITGLRSRAEQAERERTAERAAKTRLKKRAAAGICPCCNRQFSDLQSHVAEKHPEFADQAGVKAKNTRKPKSTVTSK